MTTHHCALLKLKAGDWQAAHRLIQDETDELACQIHGLLHRVEGDLENAGWWYRRAGLQVPSCSIEEEQARLIDLCGATD